MNLIPWPKEYRNMWENAVLPKQITFDNSYINNCYVKVFKERIEQYTQSEMVVEFLNKPYVLLEEKKMSEDEYCLAVQSNQISLEFGSTSGLSNGLVTLFHLIREAWEGRSNAKATLTCCSIKDKPKYPHRGQSMDIVRHFFGVEEVKKIIEQISLLKMNRLHLVFANDQAWKIQMDKYPKLHESCGKDFYTKKQVRELQEYARMRNVVIIPEFEIPGHNSAAVSAYPDLCCSGKKITPPTVGGIFPFILCGGKENTYTFIQDILDELCELFDSEYIHLGGDEAPKKEWEKCPYCKQKMEELNLEQSVDLQAYMLNFAKDYLQKKGRKCICWNDALLSQQVDESIVVQYWLENGKAFCMNNIKKDQKIICSNFKPFYFDYPFCLSNLKDVYEYEPHMKGKVPIPEECILGIESAMWTEYISQPQRLEELIFPRILATAEQAWGKSVDYLHFSKRVDAYSKYLTACQIQVADKKAVSINGPMRWMKNVQFFWGITGQVSNMKKARKKMEEEANELSD